MIITSDQLSQYLYLEIIEEVSRNDSNIVSQAILLAQDECKAYMSRYDLAALFGTEEQAMDNSAPEPAGPTVISPFLQDLVINLACWRIIKRANPNVSFETFRQAYEDSVATLKRISKGEMTPQGWPLYVPTSTEPEPGTAVEWTSQTKLSNDL